MKTITLDDKEMQLLAAVVMDSDKEGALNFLTNIIWEKVKEKEPKACGPKAV